MDLRARNNATSRISGPLCWNETAAQGACVVPRMGDSNWVPPHVMPDLTPAGPRSRCLRRLISGSSIRIRRRPLARPFLVEG